MSDLDAAILKEMRCLRVAAMVVLPRDEAELYLGGSPERLDFLLWKRYLKPLVKRSRGTCFRRERIDQAVLMAEANGDDFRLPKGFKRGDVEG